MAVRQLALDVGSAREGYRGPAVCKIVGITYRQLDYWDRTDLVVPSVQRANGSGSQRLYSFNDIVKLRVIKRLLDTGVALKKVRAATTQLAQRGQELTDVTLVSDGRSVFMVDEAQEVIDLLAKGQSVFAIALGPVIEQLEGEVTAFPMEQADPIASTEPTLDELLADHA